MRPIPLIMWTAFQSFILRHNNNNNNNNNFFFEKKNKITLFIDSKKDYLQIQEYEY